MDQNDSLKSSMQQLAAIQQQQLQILKDMSAKQSIQGVQQNTQPQNYQPPSAANFYSSPYMNYAPNYMPAMFPMSQAAQRQFMQFSDYKSAITGNNKYGFIDSIWPDQDKVSNQTRTLLAMDYSSRVSQGLISGAGAVTGGIGSIVAGSYLPGILGMGTSIFGGAAIGAIVDNGLNEMKKQSAYEKYLMRESYRFINPNESVNDRDVAGFSLRQSQDAATFLRNTSNKFYMKDEEMMRLVQGYTEGGLMRDAKDLETFKDKVASLTKNVKAGALMLNETYDSISSLMSTLRKAGIDQKDFNKLMANGKILGSNMGLSGSEVTRNLLQNTMNINSGTGYSNTNLMSRMTDTYLYADKWYESLREKPDKNAIETANFNMISNIGGPEQAAPYIQQAQENLTESSTFNRAAVTFFDYNSRAKQFEFNRNKYRQFINGNVDYQTLMNEYESKMNDLQRSGNQGAILDWQQNSAMYVKNSLNDSELTNMLTKTIHSFAQAKGIDGANLNFNQVLGLMGVQDNNTRNLMSGYLQYHEQQGDALGANMRLQSIWEQQNAEVRSQTPSISDTIRSGWDRFKKVMAEPFTDIKDAIDRDIIGFSDNLYNLDDKIMSKPDKYYRITSGLSSFNSADVRKNFEEATNAMALVGKKLEDFSSKGFGIDSKLSDFLKDSVNSATSSVSYTRDIIKNWDDIDKSILQFKDTITGAAKNNDISESILAALTKWDQQSGNKTSNEKIKEMAEKLGKLTFDYGGNKELALAAFAGGDSTVKQINDAVKNLGYSIDDLRKNGSQGILQGLKLDDLGIQLGDAVKKAIEDINKTNIGNSGINPLISGDFLNKDLRTSSGVTAADLDAIIDQNTSNKPSSIMRGQGKAFYDAATTAGIDPLYFLSHAGLESGWGTSDIARQKGNFFGIGAFDSSPMASAYTFGGNLTNSLTMQANWIKQNYLNQGQNTLYSMRNNGGQHEYATDAGWDEKIADIMSSSAREVGKVIGTLGSSSGAGINFETIGVNKDKNRLDIKSVLSSVEAPTRRASDSSFNVIKDILNLSNGMQYSEADYNKDRTAIEKDIKDKENLWEEYYSNRKWKTYQSAVDELNDYNKTWGASSDGNWAQALRNTVDKTKKDYEDYVNSKTGGDMDKLKALDDRWQTLQSDKQGVTTGLSTYQEGLLLQQLGKQVFGITSDGKSLEDYNKQLIDATTNYYNENYDALSNFSNYNANPNTGTLSASGKKWRDLDMTDKATTIKMLQMLGGVKSLQPGIGNRTGVSSAYAFTSDEKSKLNHLFYAKDKNGKKTNNLYYDPYNENSEAMTADDLLSWQTQGGVVDYLSAAKTAIDKTGKQYNISVNDGATFEELTKATKDTYTKVMSDSYATVASLNAAQEDLKKNGINMGFSNTEINKIMDAVKNKDVSALEAVRSQLQRDARKGREVGDATDEINSFIDLVDKMKGLKTDDFQKILDQIDKMQKTAADVGKGAKMLGGILDESGKINFNEAIKSAIGPELQKFDPKQILEALQNGGKITDSDGKVQATIDAHDMETLSEKVSDAMSKAVTDQLTKSPEGRDNLRNSAVSLNDDKLVDEIDQLNALFSKEKEVKGVDLDKLKQVEQQLETDIVQKYLTDLAKVGTVTDEATKKAGELGGIFEKYDKSISDAIQTMKDRLDKGWPGQLTAYSPQQGGFTTDLGDYRGSTANAPNGWVNN
jgi:beta-N-acetylglucosaminidase